MKNKYENERQYIDLFDRVDFHDKFMMNTGQIVS